jgi:hypothetical protein
MTQKKKGDNAILNIVINVVLPSILLSKGNAYLGGPTNTLIVALSLPLGYGIWDYLRAGKMNFISIIGIVSTFSKGILSVLEVEPLWIAVNEALLPLVIGLLVLITNYIGKPLVQTLLLNESVINLKLLHSTLEEHNSTSKFYDKIKQSSFFLFGTFILSAILNYVVARYFIKSISGSEQYNIELGQMNAWSFVIIGLPLGIMSVLILLSLFKSVKRMTGHSFEYFLVQKEK